MASSTMLPFSPGYDFVAARRMTIRIYDESAREKSEACVIVRIMRA